MTSIDHAGNYGTPAELTQAAGELGDYWRALGRDLRQANADAAAAWPLHNTRVRQGRTARALVRARDAMYPGAKKAVEHAEALKRHRQLVNVAFEQLTGADGDARLHLETVDSAEKWMPAHACPTWKTIVGRWKAARAASDFESMDTSAMPAGWSDAQYKVLRQLDARAVRLLTELQRRRQA